MPAKTSKPQDQSAETPHYHGHRERLRERFHSAGADALSDYELLELILFQAKPRQDTKPLAKALLARFGSFAGVIGAEIAALMAVPGMGEASVVALKGRKLEERAPTIAARAAVARQPALRAAGSRPSARPALPKAPLARRGLTGAVC